MNTKTFTPKILVLAVLATFNAAYADDDINQLTKPSSSISVGVGATTGDARNDRSIFGQYNGLRKPDQNLLLDLDYTRRNDETGTWGSVQARNLGLDNREISYLIERQGNWKLFAEYNEITKHDIRTVNTADSNVGSTTPVVNVLGVGLAGKGANYDFDLQRKGISLSGEKWITNNLQFELSFKNEDKKGERLTGRGYDCATYVCSGTNSAAVAKWATIMLAEPVDSTTRQIEAKLNWSGEQFLLSTGYYASFFNNGNNTINATVPSKVLNADRTGLATNSPQAVLQMPMALAPDNQAHQLYVDGYYAFTPTTRVTSKVALAHASQSQNFLESGLTGAPAGYGNLGGHIDSELVQLGVSSRPMSKLSINGNVRYENKDDKTPLAVYNIENTATWTNSHASNKKLDGKLEASYQLPNNFRATAGVDYAEIKRNIENSATVAGMSALRKNTDETGYRLELRRSMSDTVNATLSFKTSKRRGDEWYNLVTGTAAASLNAAGYVYGSAISASELLRLTTTANPSTVIFPVMLQDRDRKTWKLAADWAATERLSLQFNYENSDDKFVNNGIKGVQSGGSKLYNVDASFDVNDKLKLTGFVSRLIQDQAQNWSTGYDANLHNTNSSSGLGVQFNPNSLWQIGGDWAYSHDSNAYQITVPNAATALLKTNYAANGGLPDVTFKQNTLKFFAKYALKKNADVRVDLVHQLNELKEWSWNYNGKPYTYSDNTTVNLNDKQQATFVGARYMYKF